MAQAKETVTAQGGARRMSESIEVSTHLPASPKRIYEAWLSSQEHSAFTGGTAVIDPKIGGKHTAWDDYIQGTTIELEPYRRIVQTWRTSEFPPDSPDSRLEVWLEKVKGGTQLTLRHTNIPDGQGKSYESGWAENYFEPMRKYFS